MPTSVQLEPEPMHEAIVNPKTGDVPGVPKGNRTWSKQTTVCQAAHVVPYLREPYGEETTGDIPQYGYTKLLTGNPVRAAGDDCRHHLGGWWLDHKRNTRPLMCSGAVQGPFQGERYSSGEWFVAEATTPVSNNGFALVRGYTYGLIPYENPSTYLMMWDSHWGGGPFT